MNSAGNKVLLLDCDRKDELKMAQHEPTLRLHLWLEVGNGVLIGAGRALLLAGIEEHGSLRKAAEDLGMSYRAAWGKIKKTEKLIGVKLIAQNGCKRGGHLLTSDGRKLMERYFRWVKEVEQTALDRARDIFPWLVKSYEEKIPDKIIQCLVAVSLSCSSIEALIGTGI